MSDEEIIERTWHLTSRISTIDCHTKILQVFCAIQYQPNGFCSPPNFVDQLYPERGLRPKFLWEKLTTWQTLPHKVCKSYFIFRENYSTYCLVSTWYENNITYWHFLITSMFETLYFFLNGPIFVYPSPTKILFDYIRIVFKQKSEFCWLLVKVKF